MHLLIILSFLSMSLFISVFYFYSYLLILTSVERLMI